MKQKRFWAILLIVLLVGLGCALPASWRPSTPEPTQPAGTGDFPSAALKAQASLANDLGVSVGDVEISDFKSSHWSDSCLEAPNPGETCTSVETPGWTITLKYGGSTYIYHSDQPGDNLRRVQGVVDPGPIALQSVQLLAGLMGYNPEAVQILSETPTTFQDTCLGLVTPGLTCEVIPSRGEIVRLQANDMVFELRSQNDPIDPVVAEIQGVSTASAAITWTRLSSGSGQCSNLVVYPNNVVIHYDCGTASGREPSIATLTPEQQSQLLKWFVSIQKFDYTQGVTNGDSARLYFSSIGKVPPTDAQKALIFQYTNTLVQNLFLSQPTPSTLNFGP